MKEGIKNLVLNPETVGGGPEKEKRKKKKKSFLRDPKRLVNYSLPHKCGPNVQFTTHYKPIAELFSNHLYILPH